MADKLINNNKNLPKMKNFSLTLTFCLALTLMAQSQTFNFTNITNKINTNQLRSVALFSTGSAVISTLTGDMYYNGDSITLISNPSAYSSNYISYYGDYALSLKNGKDIYGFNATTHLWEYESTTPVSGYTTHFVISNNSALFFTYVDGVGMKIFLYQNKNFSLITTITDNNGGNWALYNVFIRDNEILFSLSSMTTTKIFCYKNSAVSEYASFNSPTMEGCTFNNIDFFFLSEETNIIKWNYNSKLSSVTFATGGALLPHNMFMVSTNTMVLAGDQVFSLNITAKELTTLKEGCYGYMATSYSKSLNKALLVGSFGLITEMTVVGASITDVIENDIKIYPNPTTNKIIIESNIINDKIEIYNSIGQIILTNYVTVPTFEVDISYLPSDMYFLKLYNKNNNNIILKKIIKQ